MNFPTYFKCQNAINNQKIQSIKDYKKAYSNDQLNNLLKSQQETLKECILSNATQNFFNVFDMKCSVGKTFTAVNSMPYYLNNVAKGLISKKGVLFVVRQTDECDKYVDTLNSLFVDNYTGHYSNVAFAFHYKKYTNEENDINEEERQKLLGKIGYYPILFICHETYIKLAEDEKARKTFVKDRRLLIIDESIDICETVEIRNTKIETNEEILFLERIEELSQILQEEDRQILKNIMRPLIEKFVEISEEKEAIINRTFNFKINHKRFNESIEIFVKKCIQKYEKSIQKELKRLLKTVSCIYNDTCLINKRINEDESKEQVYIKTLNRNKRMWLLENNIILDASAPFELKYKLDKNLYFLMNNYSTLDYSKWHIEYILANTTKYAKGIGYKSKNKKQKSRYIKFLQGCSQIIKDLGINDVLVVLNKDEHTQINKVTGKEKFINPFEDFDINVPISNIAHFGNITGKRDFENLKNVLIAHTPNYSDSDYILQYMYYTGKRYNDNEVFETTSVEGLGYTKMFNNQELQEFKEKTIANHIYQAVCRVNREMKEETTVCIITEYLGSVLYVRDMLNCKCICNTTYDKYFEVGKNQTNDDRKQNSKDAKLKNLFEEILKGNINSYDIDYTEINSNILKVKKEDIKKCLKFNKTQFDKAKSKNDKFISDNTIICCREYYYFILDTK